MKTFRTLDMAIEFYDEVSALKISGHLRDQLLRSASSISLNLSEGNAKSSISEKKRFYQIAYASLKESETALRLLRINDPAPIQNADRLGASLYWLMNSKAIEVMDSRRN